MSTTQRLDIRQSQSLVMTPQLQQAIKLLEMTNLELSSFVQDEMNSNPLLEETSYDSASAEDLNAQNLQDNQEKLMQLAKEMSQASLDNHFSDVGSDRAVSHENNDPNRLSGHKDFSGGSTDIFAADRNNAFKTEETLREKLSSQLHMSTNDPITGLIGSYIIGLVQDTGYLTETIEEIAGALMVPEEYVEKTLKLCKNFEPTGIFAHDLQECLSLQLEEKGQYDQKHRLLLENLDLLAKKEFKKLSKLLDADTEKLAKMISNIKRCNPKPGLEYASSATQILIPDVLIEQKHDGGWTIELNSETLPKVAVNNRYKLDIQKDGEETFQYIKDQQARASWLLKSLEQRADTILRVSKEILRQQDGFFAYGFSELRPMNLKLVAEELELHESTISRVTSGKYMRCPKGVFELKFFFMSGITGADGEASVSSQSVKHLIKKLIDAEDAKNILSDEDLVNILKKQDINVARRTVAKYRESLGLASSVQRRREKNHCFKIFSDL